MDDKKEIRGTPLSVLFLSNCLTVVGTVIGLMSTTQSKIHWKSYFRDGIDFYQDHVTNPIGVQITKVISYLEQHTAISFDWIPWWLPDYLPIASAFSIGAAVSYCHLEKTNPIKICYEFIFREFIPGLKKDFGETIFNTLFTLILLLIAFLTSPILYLSIPAILLLLMLAMILIGYLIVKTALIYFFKWAIVVMAYAIPLISIAWVLIDKKDYLSFLESSCKVTRTFITDKYNYLKSKTPEYRKTIKSSLINIKYDANKSLIYIYKFFKCQHYVVGLILLFFLIAYALNSSMVSE